MAKICVVLKFLRLFGSRQWNLPDRDSEFEIGIHWNVIQCTRREEHNYRIIGIENTFEN